MHNNQEDDTRIAEFMAILWSIWLLRNNIVFNKSNEERFFLDEEMASKEKSGKSIYLLLRQVEMIGFRYYVSWFPVLFC